MEKLSKYMLRGRVVKGSVVRGRIDVEPSMTDTNCLKCHESFYSMLLSFPVSCFWESFASFRFRSRKKEKTGRRLLLQKHSCIITYADKRGETSEDSSWGRSRKRRSSSGLFLSWDSRKSLPSRLLNIFFQEPKFFFSTNKSRFSTQISRSDEFGTLFVYFNVKLFVIHWNKM